LPVTPLHLGPAALACYARPSLHCPALLAGTVLIDLEPGAVIFLGLNARVHGPLHTLAAALVLGSLVGVLVARSLSANAAASGALGWAIHVLLDSPLYPDITPLQPLTDWNPLYAPETFPLVYAVSTALTLVTAPTWLRAAREVLARPN